MTSPWCPTPTAELEFHPVADGAVVYEPADERVHYLNATAAAIYALCDGATTTVDIATLVQDVFTTTHVPLAETVVCLDELLAKGLLQ